MVRVNVGVGETVIVNVGECENVGEAVQLCVIVGVGEGVNVCAFTSKRKLSQAAEAPSVLPVAYRAALEVVRVNE